MAAAVTIRVFTGAAAGTSSNAVSGIDLISADNATNSAANRISFPVAACSFSYEKWIRAAVDTSPDNKVENFQMWGDGGVMALTTLYYGVLAGGVTPVATCSPNASALWSTATSDAKIAWDSASYKATGSTTAAMVFQLKVDTTACAGNWTQETISYSFDEA